MLLFRTSSFAKKKIKLLERSLASETRAREKAEKSPILHSCDTSSFWEKVEMSSLNVLNLCFSLLKIRAKREPRVPIKRCRSFFTFSVFSHVCPPFELVLGKLWALLKYWVRMLTGRSVFSRTQVSNIFFGETDLCIFPKI